MKAALYLVLAIICLLPAAPAQAQSEVPGYLGRRITVEYSLATWSPFYLEGPFLAGLSNYKGTKLGWPDDQPYFRSRHMLGMNMCLSRRSVIGAHFSWQQAGYYSGYFSFSDNFQDTLGQIKIPGLQVHWRSYYFLRRSTIAPVGPFTELGYAFMFPALRPVGAPGAAPVARRAYGTFSLQTGYTFALANRFLLSPGMELQVPLFNQALHPLTVVRRDDGNEGVLFDAMSRLTSLNFRLGLQFLLF